MEESTLSTLLNQIPIITYQFFETEYQIKFKNSPKIETTVLCSFSLFNTQNGEIKIASVGFGTKSVPHSIAVSNEGKIIKDMHAEILARRGFIKFLIENLPQKESENLYFKWDSEKKKHKFLEKYKVVLFTSEVPCGDCMVEENTSLFSGARPLKYFLHKEIPNDQFLKHHLRTKPGRLDLPIEKRSLSLSCTDKIGTWNILGVQGKVLFNVIFPIFIDFMIVESFHDISLKTIEQGVDFGYRIHEIKNIPLETIKNKLFKLKINNKLKKITNQFKLHRPKIILIKKESKFIETEENEDKKLELCGIISGSHVSWLSGKTGLPEGVSIKKINKVSPFCSMKMYEEISRHEEEEFKYSAIKERIKIVFGEWTDDYKENKK